MTAKKPHPSLDEMETRTGEEENKEKSGKDIRQPVVTQVVEVVGEGSERSVDAPSQDVGQTTMKLKPDPRVVGSDEFSDPLKNIPKDSDTLPEAVVQSEGEKEEKEVINELFQKDTRVGYPEISEHKKRPAKGLVLWGMVVVIVTIAIGGMLLFFTQGPVTVTNVAISPAPSKAPEPSVTATPAAELKKSDLKVQILNGGGVRGAAGKMKSLLEEKGYVVADTGNTDQYSYEETEIYVKPEREGYLTLLEEDLKDEYTFAKKEATLEDDVSYDARVIVGKK